MSRITLITDEEHKEKFDFSERITARKVCREVLRLENCPYDVIIGLTLVDDESIRALNSQFRGIDKSTDVLSFPNLEFPSPSDFDEAAKDAYSCFDPDSGKLVLGDIVLNTVRVREQAAAYGHSELREFAFLIAHSVLHLCGYDHMTPDEAAVMEKKQEEALEKLGILREAVTGTAGA